MLSKLFCEKLHRRRRFTWAASEFNHHVAKWWKPTGRVENSPVFLDKRCRRCGNGQAAVYSQPDACDTCALKSDLIIALVSAKRGKDLAPISTAVWVQRQRKRGAHIELEGCGCYPLQLIASQYFSVSIGAFLRHKGEIKITALQGCEQILTDVVTYLETYPGESLGKRPQYRGQKGAGIIVRNAEADGSAYLALSEHGHRFVAQSEHLAGIFKHALALQGELGGLMSSIDQALAYQILQLLELDAHRRLCLVQAARRYRYILALGDRLEAVKQS